MLGRSVNEGVEPGVPGPYGHKQRNGCQYRLTQREYNTHENFEITSTVNTGRFHQAFRQRADIGADNDHIEGTDHRRKNIYPEAVQQVKLLDQEIPRNQTGAEIHGKHEDHSDRFAEHIFLAAQGIGQHCGQENIQNRRNHRTCHRDPERIIDGAGSKDSLVILRGPHSRPQIDAAAYRIIPCIERNGNRIQKWI
ncbi:hypothetical protein D3C75_862050 [compost metagenome]